MLLAACYTPKTLTQADLMTREAAFRSGQLPPENLWLRTEYDAYWLGYGWASDDLYNNLVYSVSRHQDEVSEGVLRFYREGYLVGWREYAAEADPEEYPNAKSHLTQAAPAPEPAQQPTPAPPAPRRSKPRPAVKPAPTPAPVPAPQQPRLRKI